MPARARFPPVLDATWALFYSPSRWLEGTTEAITRPLSAPADGRTTIRFNGRSLDFREIFQDEARPPLSLQPKAIKPKTGNYIPLTEHPWRRSNAIIHRQWAQGIF